MNICVCVTDDTPHIPKYYLIPYFITIKTSSVVEYSYTIMKKTQINLLIPCLLST